ncbi:MAG: beta-ketoacyl synthase N-terminal-like domain-containing protein [Thiobacillaceae bacterium]
MSVEVDAQIRADHDLENSSVSILEGPPLVFPENYPLTLSAALHSAAHTKKQIVFVDDRGGESTLSYRELLDKATLSLGGLQKLGALPGSKVILQLDGLEEFLVIFWACILGGIVPVPVLPFRNATSNDSGFKKLQGIAYQLNDPIILMSDRNADLIRGVTGDKNSSAESLSLNGHVATYGDISNSRVVGVFHQAQPDDLAFLQFTSGSTSFPKGTQISHENVLVTIHSLMTSMGVRDTSCLLNWMPYYHDMGLIAGHLMAVVSMCRVVAMKPFAFVRRPMLWLTKIHEYRVSVTFSPNFGLRRILEKATPELLAPLDLSCLDVILNGAEPISVQTCDRFLDLLNTHCGLRRECMLAGYGLAEASLAVTIAPRGELFRKHFLNRDALGCGSQIEHVAADSPRSSCFIDEGPAVTGMDLRIVNDDDQVMPVGTVGHVQVKGPSVTRGYFANPDANEVSSCGEWFRTGDLGFVHDDRFVITGRVKDIVYVNGQNYYSHDFEHACEDIQGLDNLVVIGYHDPDQEEEVILAFIACNKRFTGAREKTAILRKVQMRINQCFDVTPTLFVLLKSTGEIPKTTSGKVIRHKLLENYLEGQFSSQCIQLVELLEIAPDLSSDQDSGKHVTISELKLLIRHLWSEVLGISQKAIGDHDPFFSLGGTSIKAIEVISLAEETIDCPITHDMFREHDTIHRLANYIARENITIRCKLSDLVEVAPYKNQALDAEPDCVDEIEPAANEEPGAPKEDICEHDIAIIGMGCLFPQADNIGELWQLLMEGRDCVTEMPNDRCDISQYYDREGKAPNTTVSKWGSFIDHHHFDAKFFSLNEHEAITMDPHQRVFLKVAWQAIQDSGLVGIEGSRMGVFVGASGTGFYQQREFSRLTPSTLTGSLANLAAARVSNAFNLKGPSLSVDTACSSSLFSVDMACKSILNGDCDTALAGGVQVMESIVMYLLFSSAGILSPDGKCYTFSDKANGFVPGEGAGAVVLKRYSQAIADGDRVYAVIKASASNNDGASLGIMAPNPEGQETVIRAALKQADINPADIGYVEAHGTGTNIGDLIEIRSLALAFNEKNPVEKQSCAIGSIKTNFGHQLAAAGIASLMKAALAVYHSKIPATLNCENERKEIKFADTPFFVCHQAVSWPKTESRRLASVNSFGFGGTNVHVILRNAYHAETRHQLPSEPGEPQVYCLSAKSEASLDASRIVFERFATHCPPETNARDIAYTYGARRDHYRQNRIAIVANSLEDAAQVARGGKVEHAVLIEKKSMSRTRRRIAWLFSGQGSQHPGMGKTLFNTETVFRDIINVCDEIAHPLLGTSLRDLLVSSTEQDEISSTAITQPIVFTMDYALATLWQSWGVKPDTLLGHSIGEYVAACLGGMFSLEDALKTVIRRGALMGAQPAGGGMTAVLQSPDDLLKSIALLGLPLDIAAYNGPLSTVVSGELVALKELHIYLDTQATAHQSLQVSHAFHSRHMEPVLDEFKKYLAGLSMKPAAGQIISNVSGALYQGNECTPEYWASHIRQPVQFHKGVQNLVAAGSEMLLEVGNHAHLTGLARRIINGNNTVVLSTLPKHVSDATESQHLAVTLASLYANGIDIKWDHYYSGHGDRRGIHQAPVNNVARPEFGKVGTAGGRMISVPHTPLERRSMFRVVENHDYPFQHLFKRIGEGQFEYVPDPDSVLFRDHVVCRTPMLSGAGQCDLISHLHALSFAHAPKHLRGLSFHQPWLGKSNLTVAFTGKDEKDFAVTDARGNLILKGHSTTFTRSEVPPSISVQEIEQRLPHSYSHEAVYDIFSRCGIEYGAFHRHIASLRASPTEALARLSPVNDGVAQKTRGYYLHPGILDSAFQATAGLLMARMEGSQGEESFPTMVPIGIESICVYKFVQGGEYFSHVTLDDTSSADVNSDIINCNINLYDNSGAPCARITKLQLKRMPGVARPKAAAPQTNAIPKAAQNTDAAEFFHATWKAQLTVPAAVQDSSSRWLVFGSRDASEQQFAPTLADAGVDLLLVPYAHYWNADTAGIQTILEKSGSVNGIVFLGDYEPSVPERDAADVETMRVLFNLFKAISTHSRKNKDFQRIRFIRATRHAYRLAGNESRFDIRKSLATGFLRSARLEFPLMDVRQVDLGDLDAAQTAYYLHQELIFDGSEAAGGPEALYFNQKRHSLAVEPLPLSIKHDRNTVFNADKTFWIIGGVSGVGQVLARHLASNFKCNLVLSGTRKLPDPEQYDSYVAANKDAIASTIEFIRGVEALDSRVTYISTDVRSADSMCASLAAIHAVHPNLNGIYFSALQLDDKMILQKEWAGYRNMIDMRVNGVDELIRQTQSEKLDFFVLFSSLAGITGNIGQSDYSASNVYMDTVPYAQASDNPCRYITVQWGPWELGQQVSEFVLEQMQRNGFLHVSAQSGMAALEKIILSGEKNAAFVPGSFNAGTIADNLNTLRQGLKTKPKASSTVQPKQKEEHVMSTTNPKADTPLGGGQIQLLMSEFEKQREMLMRLYENQNSLLSSALSGVSMDALPQNFASRPAPSLVPAAAPVAYVAPEPVYSAPEAIPPAAAVFQPSVTAPVTETAPQAPSQNEPPASMERPANLFDYVRSLMAKAVEMHETDIDPDQNIMELGADSMTAMSMVKELETCYKIELPATLLFEYSTLNELVDFLKTEIGN